MKVTLTFERAVPVRYLQARCGVRYWEDATVDGVEDTNGTLIPCRDGDYWCPLIDLETGKIKNWKPGVVAAIHYQVCDDGEYVLLDGDRKPVFRCSGYVPEMLSPKEPGYGDYVIMDVAPDGAIMGWKVELLPFENDED